MRAFSLRYYSFVARFVDAVTTDALAQELGRDRADRQRAAPQPVTAPRELPAKAA